MRKPLSHGRRLTAAVVVLVAVALPGCGGGDRVPLQGSVTYDGAAIDNGTITFVPEGGGANESRPKASTRIADGKYAFERNFGPYRGQYKVEITWDKKTGRKVSTGDADTRDETKQVLPPKYNAQTTLTAEVTSETTRDFALPK